MPHKKKKNKKSLINNNNEVMMSHSENKENVVIPVIQMVSHPLGSCISMISYQELCKQYKQLESENKKLTDKLLESSNINIETLVNENKSLKEKIQTLLDENKELINQNKELSKCIVELKHKNEELNSQILELKQENKTLKEEINKINLNTLQKNLMIGINDINEIYKLEKNSDYKFSKCLYNLRQSRDGMAHYIRTIDYPDTEEMKQYKMTLIRDKLKQYNKLTRDDKSRIVFPIQLIDILNKNITINKFNLDEDDKKFADNFWNM